MLSESLTEQNGKSSTIKSFVVVCFFFLNGEMLAWEDPFHVSSRQGTTRVGILKANQVELCFEKLSFLEESVPFFWFPD